MISSHCVEVLPAFLSVMPQTFRTLYDVKLGYSFLLRKLQI